MAGQKGRDVLLRISDGGSPAAYETVAGIRTKSIELASAVVDGTSADSPEAWRELIAGAGTKTARVRGAGVFKDAASDARMRAVFFAGEAAEWRLVVPDFGTLAGPFQITDLAWGGDHDGEATFSLTLQSAGALSFEAVS
ncbi:MAG: phage major tail protein, TP901-1 family [Pseudomonadota bacterium]